MCSEQLTPGSGLLLRNPKKSMAFGRGSWQTIRLFTGCCPRSASREKVDSDTPV
jgi:hypothetical protein